MRKRDPMYSSATTACFWELRILAQAAHPSVSAMAKTLLAGQPVSFHGDPLREFTLMAFLEKLAQKKAKRKSGRTATMNALMERADLDPTGRSDRSTFSTTTTTKTTTKTTTTKSLGQVTGDAFAALAEGDVAPEDLFFHRYYNLEKIKKLHGDYLRIKQLKAQAAALGEEDSDAEDDFLDIQEDREGFGAAVGGDENDDDWDEALRKELGR